ncbi:MAG: tetraacyldisaccharide 4'-kinase [bacterium]|jgi:tetraacyldisaccharide 4'-kinase
MHFKNIYLRSFRLFLFPISFLYGLIIKCRNFLYDKKVIEGVTFNIPIIGVGNLSVGGTGKSPMVDYLASLLKDKYPIAILSRGYKRRTSGYVLADENTTAIEIGDEPMQFHLKHPDISVSVGEKRIEAIPQLLYDRPETKLIILDDAFQHREINAGLNILLSEYSNLYTRDFFLPTGDLRDQQSSAVRSDVIVVTKCPTDVTEHQRFLIMRELAPSSHQHLFFTTIKYNTPYHIVNGKQKKLSKDAEILLVCGIANPEPLTAYIHEMTSTYDALFFSDHHIFSIDDLTDIVNRFNRIKTENTIILTTEKDAVRLVKFRDKLIDLPFYVLPISFDFLFDQEKEFKELIMQYPKTFYEHANAGLTTLNTEVENQPIV